MKAVELAIRRCPAYGTLVHPPAVEIVVNGTTEAQDQRRSA
jgi:hypothetical protein